VRVGAFRLSLEKMRIRKSDLSLDSHALRMLLCRDRLRPFISYVSR